METAATRDTSPLSFDPALDLQRLSPDDRAWLAFVERAPAATPFHHPDWMGLLAECYGMPAYVLALRSPDDAVLGGVPVLEPRRPLGGRRLVSLPFTDWCAPLALSPELGELLVAMVAADDAIRQAGGLEVRSAVDDQRAASPRLVAVRHVLPLPSDPETAYRGIASMHRRNISRAARDGVEVRFSTASTDMETFYRLHLVTRRRLGVPVQPRRFFDLLYARLIAKGLGFLLIATVAGAPAAAAVFLAWNGTLIYKYGASDPNLWSYRPNNSLFWAAIRWGCEHGCHTFDWGRTDVADSGLREFKSRWGAEELALTYTIVGRPVGAGGASSVKNRRSGGAAQSHETPDAGQPPSHEHRSASRVEEALRLLIQHSPPRVCQLIGERFYRFAD